MKNVSTLSSAYQITVPSVVRKAMGLVVGDKLEFTMNGNAVAITKTKTQKELVEEMLQTFDRMNKEQERRMTPEQKKFAKMSAGWTINQYHEYFDSLPETKAYIKEKYGV